MNQNNFVSINNKSIYYNFINKDLLSENKPIIVFLHEGLGCSQQWKDFPLIISQKLQMPALVYDRYGYGMSENLKEKWQADFLEKEAKDFMPKLFKELKIDDYKKILVGHSDGATIAIIHTSVFPDNIIGIVTEAAHVFIEKITKKGLKNTIELFNKTDLCERLEKYHGEKTKSMFESWTSVWLSDQMSNWNIEHYLENISCPFLAIQGKNDNYGTKEQLEAIKRNTHGRTKILFIPDCGHTPHHQATEIVIEEIIRFIKSINVSIIS